MDPSGEAYFLIPDEMWDELDWEIGDTIDWQELPHGGYELRKQDERSSVYDRF
jgi:hypothetical protein